MLFAYDYNDKRVHIDETCSNQEYYCPYCGEPLITRKGDVRQHHFSHKKNTECSDSWAGSYSHSYDLSPWHNEWQSLFPQDNQEVKLSLGETRHRADVMIDRTVIEFQHSIMPVEAFDNRNNFYFNLGHKVIWMFDLSDLLQKGQLSYEKREEDLRFSWKNPKKAFNSYDIKTGCIDLFFQLREESDKCIVRVMDVSPNGFETFDTTDFMSKGDFLAYVGLKDGKCLPPCREDIENNQQYQEFKEKYDVWLNKQQERALLAVEGANLLLAVPGSGKTTVLVARLGHMVINKGIPPETILAVTYGKNADTEMRKRFSTKFGDYIGKRIDFRTINSLSLKIYSDFCEENCRKKRTLIDDSQRRKIINEAFEKYHNGERATENDYLELSAAISYIKNMMLDQEQIAEIERGYPYLGDMYKEYQESLEVNTQMDFDDQMVYAHALLEKRENVANKWRARYRYICVDEAQDTSKIQHEIIRMLAMGNSIFMVGDEDQSIYGYRAAYPKALLNFRYRYMNPYILRMERNYRSTNQIVNKAQQFISQNKGRYEKNMTAERGDGEPICVHSVISREEQFVRLLEVASGAKEETAFLYRDNESAVVLVDLLLRNNIPFRHRKVEMNFFGTRVVREMTAYLSLAVNENDADAFKEICNKGIIYLPKKQMGYVDENCKKKKMSVYDALDTQMPFLKEKYRDRGTKFRSFMSKVSRVTSSQAISLIMEKGYEKYLQEKGFSSGKIELLAIMARREPNIRAFLERLKELEHHMQQGSTPDTCKVILSTIHSSKGLEYDTVYMVDVYDGRFPFSRPDVFSRSKDAANGEQEERRLFYVGMTRAKNHLHFFRIHNRPSQYIDFLFPVQPEKETSQEKSKTWATQRSLKPPNMMAHIFDSSRYPQATEGMRLLHAKHGELQIKSIKTHNGQTIISVVDSKGKISQKVWEILWNAELISII